MVARYLLNDGSRALAGDLDAVNAYTVKNLKAPVNANDAARKTDADAASTAAANADANANSRVLKAGDTMTGSLTMQANILASGANRFCYGWADPVISTDVVTLGYFDTHDANTSDARLKTNIQRIQGALAKVRALRGVTYDWNARAAALGVADQTKLGLVAQEVEAVIPGLIKTASYVAHCHAHDRYDEDRNLVTHANCPACQQDLPDARTIDYPRLAAYLVEAIKELADRLDAAGVP